MIKSRRILSFICITLSVGLLFSLPVSAVEGEDPTERVTEATSEIFETVLQEETEPEPVVLYYGDIDGNGRVTSSDARAVLRFCARLSTLTVRQCVMADMDKSGSISSSDARKVLRAAARLETWIPFDASTVQNGDDTVSQYDKRRDYVSSLSGFSTNIRDPRVFDKLKKLENYCATLGNTTTFYYTDVNNQYYIQYNSNRVYRTQCTVKAPYVKSILVYMEQNNIPLTTTLTMRKNQRWSGHYLTDNFPTGSVFTIRDLIYYTIHYSDNTAYQMLFDYFGAGVFNASAEKAGSSLRLGSYVFGETSASDMAKLFLDIYRYNGRYKDILFDEMENASMRQMILAGVPDGIRVIHKYGTGASMTVGYHDCAVIFTEVPCVLVIYTSLNRDRNFAKEPFVVITSDVIDINRSVEYF